MDEKVCKPLLNGQRLLTILLSDEKLYNPLLNG